MHKSNSKGFLIDTMHSCGNKCNSSSYIVHCSSHQADAVDGGAVQQFSVPSMHTAEFWESMLAPCIVPTTSIFHAVGGVDSEKVVVEVGTCFFSPS